MEQDVDEAVAQNRAAVVATELGQGWGWSAGYRASPVPIHALFDRNWYLG